MSRKQVVEHVQEKREPYAEVTRINWFTYYVKVTDPENTSWSTSRDEWRGTVRGSRARAENFAARKLRKLKRKMDWKNDVKRLDLK